MNNREEWWRSRWDALLLHHSEHHAPCDWHDKPYNPASTSDENRRLRSALDRYGRHDDDCSEWPDQNQPCDCGFTAAMSALPERKRVA
jgi:hypothetical protein